MEMAVNQQNIQSILAGGENKTTEFKRFIRDRAILGKTISAFANTDGGILIIGYDDQTEKIIGISKKEQQEIKSFVEYSDARNFCNLYSLDIEEKSLFIIEVKKKNGALQFYNGAAYVRMGDGYNRQMNSDDVKAYYTSISISLQNIDALVTQVASIYNLLIEQKRLSKANERKNFFLNLGFCFLSAVVGYLLGKFF